MSNEKLYTVAGFSVFRGEKKFRVSTHLSNRVNTLKHAGHTDIELVELPHPMTKSAAYEHLTGESIKTAPIAHKQAKSPPKSKASRLAVIKNIVEKRKSVNKAPEMPKVIDYSITPETIDDLSLQTGLQVYSNSSFD